MPSTRLINNDSKTVSKKIITIKRKKEYIHAQISKNNLKQFSQKFHSKPESIKESFSTSNYNSQISTNLETNNKRNQLSSLQSKNHADIDLSPWKIPAKEDHENFFN